MKRPRRDLFEKHLASTRMRRVFPLLYLTSCIRDLHSRDFSDSFADKKLQRRFSPSLFPSLLEELECTSCRSVKQIRTVHEW